MSEWKQAWWLAMLEVRVSLKGILTLTALTFGFALFFNEIFSISILNDVPVVFDVFFMLIFWVATVSSRPKEVQLKKSGGDIWISPYFVMLNQLPITKNVLTISRFISYYTISIPFHVVVLTLIYSFSSEFREVLPIASYLAFSIIWVCYGIVSGTMFPASDVGDRFSTLKMIVFSVLFYGGVLAGIIAVYYFFNVGIVEGSIYAANRWPVLSAIISILIAIISIQFNKGYVYKRIDKVDYLH